MTRLFRLSPILLLPLLAAVALAGQPPENSIIPQAHMAEILAMESQGFVTRKVSPERLAELHAMAGH